MPLGGQNKLHPAVTRSRSFHGFRGQQDSTGRSRVSSCRSPERARRGIGSPGSAPPATPPRAAQPQLFRTTLGALRSGLQEYLTWYQAQHRDLTIAINSTKRDSRLGMLYELDKQIKANERSLRRLEFHMSKVEALQEEHTVQTRLHAGAENLTRALACSPSTRGARDALAHAQRSARECCETMAQLEGQMENFLGEFHVKILGLVGFARLCPKDTYEVSLRHGRQRWKVRGRIGAEGEQCWSSDGTVLLPLIGEPIVVKVVELKGLVTQTLVGQVSLEPTELYRKDEQQLEININPLGTVKLQLLVSWLALEREEPLSRLGSVSGHRRTPSASSSHRTVPGSPSTPSTPDQAFFEEFYPTDDASSVFSDSLDSPAPSLGSSRHPSSPRDPSSPPWSPTKPARPPSAVTTARKTLPFSGPASPGRREAPAGDASVAVVQGVARPPRTTGGGRAGPARGCGTACEEGSAAVDCAATGPGLDEAARELSVALEARSTRHGLEDLEEMATAFLSLLDATQKGRFLKSHESSGSLTVESALGSFDFLDISDGERSECGDNRGPHEKRRSSISGGLGGGGGGGSGSGTTEDVGMGASREPSPVPVTTGDELLDAALAEHLRACLRLLLRLELCRQLGYNEDPVVRKLLAQAPVLRKVAELSGRDGTRPATQAAHVYPELKARPWLLSFWDDCCCCDSGRCLYLIPTERLLRRLDKPAGSGAACRDAVAYMVDGLACAAPRPGLLSLFQYAEAFLQGCHTVALEAQIQRLTSLRGANDSSTADSDGSV
uniref:Rho family-interacting cell polarization regulator 2-like n=1 Tax=Petromyzon marinus TaxID=7757 RepID=A0AAJ7U1U1_PETMA|nr:rho family-interacting cell polarization regulator 2-like [Petromyzon marinus]